MSLTDSQVRAFEATEKMKKEELWRFIFLGVKPTSIQKRCNEEGTGEKVLPTQVP